MSGMTIERDVSNLNGAAVLVVEDEYFLAKETKEAVRRAGGLVLGPVADVAGAMTILIDRHVDAAILDVRLGEETTFDVARVLREKGVAVIFVTGYDPWFLPDDLLDVPTYRKPTNPNDVICRLIGLTVG